MSEVFLFLLFFFGGGGGGNTRGSARISDVLGRLYQMWGTEM